MKWWKCNSFTNYWNSIKHKTHYPFNGLIEWSNYLNINSCPQLSNKLNEYGNAYAALKLLTNNMKDGLLPLNNETLNSLKEKQKWKKMLTTTFYLQFFQRDFTQDEEIIRKDAIKTKDLDFQ